MEYVSIQAQDPSGIWRTYNRVPYNLQLIVKAMRDLRRQYPNFRIRAIDRDERIVDIL